MKCGNCGHRVELDKGLVLWDHKRRVVVEVPTYRLGSYRIAKVSNVEEMLRGMALLTRRSVARREKRMRRKLRKATSRSPAP